MSETTQPLVITKLASIQEVVAPKQGKDYASVTFLLADKEGLPAGYGKAPKLLVDTRIWSMELLQADLDHETNVEVVFEAKKNDKNEWVNFLSKWNGIEKPAYEGNKGGNRKGGGGGNWQPKSPAEVHAPSLGGIVKSAIEACVSAGFNDVDAIGAIIDTGVNRYLAAIEKVNSKFSTAPKAESTTEAA